MQPLATPRPTHNIHPNQISGSQQVKVTPTDPLNVSAITTNHVSTTTVPSSTEHAPPTLSNHSPQDHASEIEPPVPGRYLVLLAAALVMFIGVGISNVFGVFQEYYTSPSGPLRHNSPDRVILIGSTSSSLYLILGAPAGRFADLVGYRPSLAIGTGLMVGALFAASVSTTYVELLFSQGIMYGLGLAFVYLPATSISRQYFARTHGVANACIISGGAVGGTVLPYLVRMLISKYGVAAAFRVLGYISAGGLLPGVFFLKPAHRTIPVWRRERGARPPMFDFALMNDVRFLALLASCTVAMVGFLPRYFLIPDSAVSQGISVGYASWLLGLMNGLSIVGRIGIGWYADRFGKVNALTLSFILCGIGHLAFWLPGVMVPSAAHPGTDTGDEATVTALFTLFVVYTGVLGSGFVSLFPVVTSHLFGAENLASKQGLLNTIVGIGVLAGPSAVVAFVGNGEVKHWAVGVIGAGVFMLAGGLMLGALMSRPLKLVERLRDARVE